MAAECNAALLNDQPYQHINMDEFQHFGYDVCHRHQGLM
jgi:hypothetical protein